MYSPSEYPAFSSACQKFGVEGCKSVSPCGHQSLMREIFRMCSRALPTSVNRIPYCLFDVGHTSAVRPSIANTIAENAHRRRCIEQLKPFPAWHDPWKAFKKLKASDRQISDIHEQAPQRMFDRITPQLIIEIFGAAPALASELCRRLGKTREAAS